MAITFNIVYFGINTPSPTFLQCKEHSLEVPFWNRACLRFAFNLVDGVESATLQASFDIFWNRKMSHGVKLGE